MLFESTVMLNEIASDVSTFLKERHGIHCTHVSESPALTKLQIVTPQKDPNLVRIMIESFLAGRRLGWSQCDKAYHLD